MAKVDYQYDSGITYHEFNRTFGSEEKCREYLFNMRYPYGFKCEHCKGTFHSRFIRGSQVIFHCKSCRKQKSLTSGTLFHRSRVSLSNWFYVFFQITHAKTSISSLKLCRQSGLNYNTVHLMRHKIMEMMIKGEECFKLEGRVEIDDAYLGGKKKGGKSGRGSENKVPFVIAVEADENKQVRKTKISQVEAFTKDNIDKWALDNLGESVLAVSDGLACFEILSEHCEHEVHVTSRMPREEKNRKFKWVDTVIANIKTSIRGAHHSLNFKRHSRRYLADFQFRFNRRFHLRSVFYDILDLAMTIKSFPRKELYYLAALGGRQEVEF